MKKHMQYILIFLLASCLLNTACKKDKYKIGGSLDQAKVNMTTYDYLKANQRGLFDTLLLLVDKAGLKDMINQGGITFFAPTDYSIHNYMVRKMYKGGFPAYTLDSMYKYDMNAFKDSLGLYIVKSTLSWDNISPTGTAYPTLVNGVQATVSNEVVTSSYLGYYNAVSVPPTIIFYNTLGQKTRCQTFGVITNTNVLGVLGNEHILFFNN